MGRTCRGRLMGATSHYVFRGTQMSSLAADDKIAVCRNPVRMDDDRELATESRSSRFRPFVTAALLVAGACGVFAAAAHDDPLHPPAPTRAVLLAPSVGLDGRPTVLARRSVELPLHSLRRH